MPFVALSLAALFCLWAFFLMGRAYQPNDFSVANRHAALITFVLSIVGVWISIRARSAFPPATFWRAIANVLIAANILAFLVLFVPKNPIFKRVSDYRPSNRSAEADELKKRLYAIEHPNPLSADGSFATVRNRTTKASFTLNSGVTFNIPAGAFAHPYRISFDRIDPQAPVVPPAGMALAGVYDFRMECLDSPSSLVGNNYNPPTPDRVEGMKFATYSLQVLVPAPEEARLGSFVVMTSPTREGPFFGDGVGGFPVVEVGSVVEFEGEKFLSIIEAAQPDRDGKTCQEALASGQQSCLAEEHGFGLFTGQHLAIFYETEPLRTITAIRVKPYSSRGISYVPEEPDFILPFNGARSRYPTVQNLGDSALFIVPTGRTATLIFRDLGTGWVLEKQTVLLSRRSL